MNILRSAAVALLALAGPALAAPSGALTVYTSQPQEQMAKVVEAFNKGLATLKENGKLAELNAKYFSE